MTGEFNSSKTRVQPLFGALLDRSESGRGWLAQLLEIAPRSRELCSSELISAPGHLLGNVIAPREGGKLDGLRACFEREAAPPAELLSWLLRNPQLLKITKPRLADASGTTRQKRATLASRDWRARDAAICDGLQQLIEHGPPRTRPVPWWAFEGPTSVDCWLETEQLLLFVEGKRTEDLSARTSWVDERNQLIRNLEAVGQEASGRPCFVLLAVENEIDFAGEEIGPRNAALRKAAPHLDDEAYERLWGRYLGQLKWERIREELQVPLSQVRALGWN